MEIDRRYFLKLSGVSLVVLANASIFEACSSLSRSDVPLISDDSSLVKALGNEKTEILKLASFAPSGHNAQPWTVRIEEQDQWIIGTTKDRWLPAVDPDNRELLLSIGAFLENLITAAQYYGYGVEYEIVAQKSSDPEIVKVHLKKTSSNESIDLKKLSLRRTVRSNHKNLEMKADDIKFIMQNTPNYRYVPRGTADADYLAEGTIEANRTQAYRDAAQKELSEWIRWSNSSAKKNMNGLTPASMEIEGIAGWFVRHFYDSDSVMSDKFRKQAVDLARKQVDGGGGWIVISNGDSNVESLIETGRCLEQILLRIREKKIAIHPMTQMLEESPWNSEISKKMGENVQFILRVGYLDKYPDPVSLRMPLSRFITVRAD